MPNYFNSPARKWKMELDLKFRMLNEEMALRLEEPFSMDEIKNAVWSYDESKAPGLDGFDLRFLEKVGRL